MKCRCVIACAALLLGSAASSAAQAVSLQFDNGRVNLTAQDAPIRSILAEWARLGGTRIVNGDRITAAPVTLELTGVTERQAMETLLRSVAGYVITARNASSPPGPSTFAGVMILPTSAAPRQTPPVTFASTPVLPPPRQQAFDDNTEPEERQGNVQRPVVNPFTPTAGVSASPVVIRPDPNAPLGVPPVEGAAPPAAQRPPSTTISTLPGTSRPGEVTPQPQQPNQR